MTAPNNALPMKHFLRVVADHGGHTPEVLLGEGQPARRITMKALEAARKGYTDYGVVCDRPWLTDKGKEVLAQWEQTSAGTSPTE